MHVNDLRGTIAIAGGSLIQHLVVRSEALGSSQPQRLDALNIQMKDWQSTNGTEHRMPALRKENLTKDNWATLNGKLVKAANTRALLPFLNNLANRYFIGHGAFNSSVRKVFASLEQIQRLMYTSEMFFTDEAKEEFRIAHERLGRHWQHLRHLSSQLGYNFWHISPKVHYTLHFVSQARLINPRFVQNYSEESLIGRVTKVWSASANGPYAASIQLTTLARLWTGLELRMSYDCGM